MHINRRRFLKSSLLGVGGTVMAAGPTPKKSHIHPFSAGKNETLSTARNLIFVHLDGGISHVDTFDLKRGSWTPDELGAQQMGPLDWPTGIMPELAQMTDKFALIRSMSAAEAGHFRGVYHVIAAHRRNPDLANEIPHFMSMLTYKSLDQRQPHHSLPSFLLVGRAVSSNGFLPIQTGPFILDASGSIRDLNHLSDGGDARFDLMKRLNSADSNQLNQDFQIQQQEARKIMGDAKVRSFFGSPVDGDDQNAMSPFVASCETAVKVLEADLGARFLQLQLSGWDHHRLIYSLGDGLFGLSSQLDQGLAYMIRELEAKPGVNGGSLLDETLIVAVGEFGRTVGPLNTSFGRDHHPFASPVLIAGGGVRGGRLIGSTDSRGEYVHDQGWSRGREMQPEDLIATIYSALGVDWSEKFTNTPSGRPFEMIETTRIGAAYQIDPLFV